MKRSEMLKIMKGAALDHVYWDDIDRMLAAAEKAGMMPPFVDGVKDPENRVDLIVDQAIYAGHCEWEKE